MWAATSGPAKLSKWVTIAIILAVSLLSSCLLLSLIVGDTFQQEVSAASQDLPTDSFMINFIHADFEDLAPSIRQIPKQIPDARELALTTRTVACGPNKMRKDGIEYIIAEKMQYKGVEPAYFSIKGFPLAEGRYFDAADQSNVAVIGADFATRGNYRLGSKINSSFIHGTYDVVGILQAGGGCADHPQFADSWKLNDMMFTPIDSTPTLVEPTVLIWHNSMPVDFDNFFQIWVAIAPNANVTTVMENTRSYLEDLPGLRVIHSSPTPPARVTHEYVAEQTSNSLEQMGFIVIAVGALSISGLMLMHVLLGAKVIGIKRALGATRDRLIWENIWKYSLLSFSGFLLSLALIQPLLPIIGNFLELELQLLPKTLLSAMLGVTLLTPLCGLIPTVEAGKVSPLDAIRDRLDWGLGKRRFDLRQIIVSLAFAAAVGTMFLVSQIGFATLAGIDANLTAVGRDMLLIEEPPPGTVSPLPTLSAADDASLCVACLEPYGETAWMAQARIPTGISADSLFRANVLAVKRDVLSVRNYKIADGNWITNTKDAVIGSDLARSLFKGESALGKTILLGNDLNSFTIVGILEARPLQLADFDFDREKAVFINWSDHKLAAPTSLFEPRIFFQAKTATAVAPAQETIQRLLAQSNPNAKQLVVRNPMENLAKSKHLTEIFSLSASIMALVAVVIACASIAALTLIQAREMQKMLALRRACGATRKEVLTIILREVLTLIVIGAVIGLAVAQIGFQWWAKHNDLPSTSSWNMVFVGLASSFIIAVLSAAWPAWHVARQAPAELLD